MFDKIFKKNKGATVEVQDSNGPVDIELYFDIVEEHSLSLQSQITDNWLENNSAMSDHIANQPLTISLRGFAGEVVYVPTEGWGTKSEGWTRYLRDRLPANQIKKLSAIEGLLPPVSNITQIAKNALITVENSFNRYKKIYQTLKTDHSANQTRLRQIFNNLNDIRNSKTALLVQTPYATFSDMYIQSLVLRQGNQNFITDIELSLKQVYFTETETTQVNKENRENCNFIQRETVENHGVVQGVEEGNLGDGGGEGEGNSYKDLFRLYISN